jgi:hypothetical protein
MRRLLLVAAGLLALGGLTIGQTAFDGTPTSPLPISQHPDYLTFDVQVHERGSTTSLPAINAQHGTDCSAPPATHPNTSFEGSVFQCRDHVMTAINGNEYGLIVLTPNRLLDFSQGGSVTFELSTEKMSNRDWWDVTVSPFLDAQALPLLSNLSQGVDLQNPNRNSVVIATDNGEGAPALKVTRNGAITDYGNPFIPANSGVTAANQAATRQPFNLTLTATHVRFERLASATGPAVVFVDRDIPALSWTQGVVQFGHHSYDPFKDGAGVAATWHWDEFDVQPSTAFTIEHAAPRALFDTGTVTFPAAPSGAYLRFSALCRPVVNGVAASKMTDSGHPEHASSYMVPIPAGSTSASIGFAADSWFFQDCQAKDFSTWALGSSVPTATPNPSTATPTVAAPTQTPTATATNTPTLAPTANATSTPTPIRRSCTLRWGNTTQENYGQLTQAECMARGQ